MIVDPYDAWEPWPVHVVQGDGPVSVVLDAEDRALVAVMPPASGRVGFTATPGPSA